MEDTTWDQKLHALTHILTSPTTSPPLYSQFFISSQIPCYLNWNYPPVLCTKHSTKFPNLHLRWGISLFLKRVFNLGQPKTSWRSKCPYYQPPPLILAKGVEEAKWGHEEKKAYARKRLSRKHLEVSIHPVIAIVVPDLLLFFLLLWNPFTNRDPW